MTLRKVAAALPLVAVVAVAASLIGCKPKAGAKCKTDGREVCADKTTALVCKSGAWTPMACRGTKGCDSSGGDTDCDQSVAQADDLCVDDEKAVCTPDNKAALECKGGKWTLKDRCLGPKGCTTDAQFVHCDNSLANIGDPCGQADDHACALDQKSMLVCKADKWELQSHCRGAKACRMDGDDVTCDESVAAVGDPCGTEGGAACSADMKAVLECKGGKMALDENCKKGCDVKTTSEHSGTVGCK